MRQLVLAVVVALAGPACALAQGSGWTQAQTLAAAPSPGDGAFVPRAPQSPPATSLPTGGAFPLSAAGQGFAIPDFVGQPLSGQPALSPSSRVAAAGEGLIAWRSSEVSRVSGDGTVDTVRLSMASIAHIPLMAQGTAYGPSAVDVTVARGWPSALLVRAGGLGVNVSPHTAFGFGSGGGTSAEAGAMVRFSSLQSAVQDRLESMGVKNGSSYGNQGRWYLFAAVRGQAVGLNMQESAGALRRTGWSTDVSSALVGDGQLGVGWRKGGIEASFGYVHRGVHVQNAPMGASDGYSDDMAALAFTYHPHW